jgi:hypothetical protein
MVRQNHAFTGAKSHKLMVRQNHAFTGFLANHTTSWLYEIMLLQDGPDCIIMIMRPRYWMNWHSI